MTAEDADANREVARTALEQVCPRGDMTLAPKCYAEDFADHVGRLEYQGLVGVGLRRLWNRQAASSAHHPSPSRQRDARERASTQATA